MSLDQILYTQGILEAANPATTWKCGALVVKELAALPGDAPCRSSLPVSRLSPHFLQRPPRLTKERPDQKFKLLPRTPLGAVEVLGGPRRQPCPGAGGDPKLSVRIRGGFCIVAWPGRSPRPREGPRGTPRLPGLRGPLLPTAHPHPQPLSLDVAPLQRDGWAGLGACLAAST